METTKGEGLVGVIRPPRLEDAGLEDCALPPEAIKEAFLKAANSIRSQAKSIFSDGGDCVNDPGPSNGEKEDALTVISPESPVACGAAEKGGLPDVGGDEVVIVGGGGDGGTSDRVLGAEASASEERKRGCVQGILEGLEIEEKGDFDDEGSEADDDDKEEKPILAEAYI